MLSLASDYHQGVVVMKVEQQGFVLGSARLLILAVIAALGGCILFFFLSASPASAEESPPADPGLLGHMTDALSQIDVQLTSGAGVVTAALPSVGSHTQDVVENVTAPLPDPARTVATVATETLATTVTIATTQLTTSATELVSALPISELVGADDSGTDASAAAELSGIANGAFLHGASTASATTAASATIVPGVTPAPASEPAPQPIPANDFPVSPPVTAVLTASSSGAAGGGSMFAVSSERDWIPLLSSCASYSSNDAVPSSSNDGSDPAPD